MDTDVWILGGYQSDFARNLTKERLDFADLTCEVVDAALGLRQKLDRAADDVYVLPHVRAAVLDALRGAQVSLDDLDGIEVHDCFTPSEYLAIDHIGLLNFGGSTATTVSFAVSEGQG
jgi:acetyl-CoA acetyltransferase